MFQLISIMQLESPRGTDAESLGVEVGRHNEMPETRMTISSCAYSRLPSVSYQQCLSLVISIINLFVIKCNILCKRSELLSQRANFLILHNRPDEEDDDAT